MRLGGIKMRLKKWVMGKATEKSRTMFIFSKNIEMTEKGLVELTFRDNKN